MWSDRKQENSNPRTGLGDSPEPGSANPARPGLAVIGKAMIIKGQIKSKEDLQVDGEVDGTLDLPNCRLTVGPNGKVGAGATAREVDVMGSIDGDVDASKKVTIRKGGRLVGDLRTAGIVIEDGAYFKGKIEIINSED
jgi:cytoskeletal protein CcmA (bactofilin family)